MDASFLPQGLKDVTLSHPLTPLQAQQAPVHDLLYLELGDPRSRPPSFTFKRTSMEGSTVFFVTTCADLPGLCLPPAPIGVCAPMPASLHSERKRRMLYSLDVETRHDFHG